MHVIGAALKKNYVANYSSLMLLIIFLQINLISVCNLINMRRVNWGIHLVNNLSTLLSLQISPIWEIKNEGLEIVETPPNPSLQHSLKNFQTK